MEKIDLTKEKEKKIIDLIKSGAIFIYPTDTIYGLGCNALLPKSIQKIKQIKSRDKDKPLSIIAPSKEWILENTFASKELIDKYLPGPFTLILKKKDPAFLSYVSQSETIGIRIPLQDFTNIIQKAGVPFITTSVNHSGEKFATSVEEIKKEIIDCVDVVINIGLLNGNPSTIILPDGSQIKR